MTTPFSRDGLTLHVTDQLHKSRSPVFTSHPGDLRRLLADNLHVRVDRPWRPEGRRPVGDVSALVPATSYRSGLAACQLAGLVDHGVVRRVGSRRSGDAERIAGARAVG